MRFESCVPRDLMGESANAIPHTQKWRRGVTHIWGNPRGQPARSAMDRPHPRGSALVITETSRPGKYAAESSIFVPNRPSRSFPTGGFLPFIMQREGDTFPTSKIKRPWHTAYICQTSYIFRNILNHVLTSWYGLLSSQRHTWYCKDICRLKKEPFTVKKEKTWEQVRRKRRNRRN